MRFLWETFNLFHTWCQMTLHKDTHIHTHTHTEMGVNKEVNSGNLSKQDKTCGDWTWDDLLPIQPSLGKKVERKKWNCGASRCTIQSLSDISSASPEHTKKTLQQCRPTHTQTETLVQTWKCTHAQIPGDKESARPAKGMPLPDICGGLTERPREGTGRRESGQPGCNGADYLSIFPPMPAQHGVNNWNYQGFLKGSPALKMLYMPLCR